MKTFYQFLFIFLAGLSYCSSAQAREFSFKFPTANFLFWINSPEDIREHFTPSIDQSQKGLADLGYHLEISRVEISSSDFIASEYKVFVNLSRSDCEVGNHYVAYPFPVNVRLDLMLHLGLAVPHGNHYALHLPACRETHKGAVLPN